MKMFGKIALGYLIIGVGVTAWLVYRKNAPVNMGRLLLSIPAWPVTLMLAGWRD